MPAAPTAVIAGTNFGARVHGRALQAAGYEVVGLVGRDVEKARQRAEKGGLGQGFADIAEALKLKPTVVAIATPPHTHADIAHQAMDAGAHVVCEKPFTLDLGQADALAAKAGKLGLIGLLGHEFRYTESSALFGRLLDEGAIGQPRLATFVAHGGLVKDPELAMPEWWFDEASGGGWLGASGSHAVDRVRDWYGEVAGVSARLVLLTDRPGATADDTFEVHFRTVNGLTGTLQGTAAAWGPTVNVTRALGPGGAMWIEDLVKMGSVEAVSGDVFVADRNGVRQVPVPDDLKLDLTGIAPEFTRNVGPFAQLYRDLKAMIDGKRPADRRPRASTFADGCANMRLLDAIRASSATDGAWISLV